MAPAEIIMSDFFGIQVGIDGRPMKREGFRVEGVFAAKRRRTARSAGDCQKRRSRPALSAQVKLGEASIEAALRNAKRLGGERSVVAAAFESLGDEFAFDVVDPAQRST